MIHILIIAAIVFGPFSDAFSEAEKTVAKASLAPIRIVFDKPVQSEAASIYEVDFHWTSNCIPCNKLKDSLDSDKRFRVRHIFESIPKDIPVDTFPVVVFRDSTGRRRYDTVSRTADQLAAVIVKSNNEQRRLTTAELREFAREYRGPKRGVNGISLIGHLLDPKHHGFTVDQLNGLSEKELLAIHSGQHFGAIAPTETATVLSRRGQLVQSARGGVIHARKQIELATRLFREKVGENHSLKFEWDRSETKPLPLLRGTAWNNNDIYGRFGEFRLSAPGATGFPVTQAALGYRFMPDGKLRLRGETEVPASVLDWSNSGRDSSDILRAEKPVGIDPMTVLTIFQLLNGIWQALNPEADLHLGPTMSCEVVLAGDVFNVKFIQGPMIKVTAWFHFSLGIESVTASPSVVDINLSGSRLIKKRSFAVEE